MKTSQGKLAVLAFLLLLAALLLVPMRSGREDDLVLSPQMLKMSPGGSYTVKCRLSAENTNQRLEFASSDEKVAAITADGTVYALDSGEAVITASASGGARAQMRVIVEGVALSELALNTNEVHLKKGEYSGLRVRYNEDATDQRLQWISGDEGVARVDKTGRIEGVGGGETYVSVITPNGKSASAKVCVDVPASAVRISPHAITVGVGAHLSLNASFLPTDCTEHVRRWISSNPQALTVSQDGEISAVGVGTAHVSALTDGGLSAGMEVIVEDAPMDLQLNPSIAAIERGDKLNLQMMLLQPDGSVESVTSHLVTWKSDDPSVATVDSNGCVTGVRSGTSRITVSSDGMKASCRVNVEVSVREIALEETEIYLLREETDQPIQLRWTITPQDADDPTITFTTNNEQVANVDDSGRITMTGGYGTAIITATARSGAQAAYTLNVVTQLPEPEPEIVPTAPETVPEKPESPGDSGASAFFFGESETNNEAADLDEPETEPAPESPAETAPTASGKSVG